MSIFLKYLFHQLVGISLGFLLATQCPKAICMADEDELLPQAVVDAVGFGTHPLVPAEVHKKLQRYPAGTWKGNGCGVIVLAWNLMLTGPG